MENFYELTHILKSIGDNIDTITDIFIGVVIYSVVFGGISFFKDKKVHLNVDNKPKFIELIEADTEYVFLINTEHIISVYSTSSGSLITFQRPDGIEEIEVTKKYLELRKLIGLHFD